jgi:glyoxylate/hydroxypyruvate reductase A
VGRNFGAAVCDLVCRAATRLPRASRTFGSMASSHTRRTSTMVYKPSSEVLLASSFGSQPIWKERLEQAGLTVRLPGEDCSAVEIGIVFNHPRGVLDNVPNLKAVQSLGAGVDFMMDDPGVVDRGVPLLRIVDPLMAERMATFCVWAVINFQRKCDAYFRAQMESRWDKSVENYKNIDNHEVSVGVMGLGLMGGKVASTLAGLGYEVYGWKRSREHRGADAMNESKHMKTFCGDDEFLAFASKSQVVINLLPLTDETHGILSSKLFNSMPRGGP